MVLVSEPSLYVTIKMTIDVSPPNIIKADAKSLLGIIHCAIKQFEYLTPSIFVAIVHVAVMSYWRGRGYNLDSPAKFQEKVALVNIGVEHLMDAALNHPGNEWFLVWLEKMSDSDDERQLIP